MLQLLAKITIYGCLGVLMEVFFTGFHSILVQRDRNAICRTSLWMVPIYGIGAVCLGLLRHLFSNSALFIPIAVVFIFGAEFCSGWLLRKVKIKAWDYSHAKFGIMGLIRIDYLPFWLMVAIGFDVLADYITRLLEYVGKMA